MRKILFLVTTVITMAGCSSSDESKLTLSTNHVSLYSEETETITASDKATWSSDDEFVASVNNNGTISGEHVGTTVVTAASNNGQGKCTVEVKAKYNTYTDPIFEFEASKSTIKTKEKRTLDDEKEESLLFKPEKSTIGGVGYLFKNGKMNAIAVNVKTSSALEATKFLIERYLVVGAGVGNIAGAMINNLPNKATMGITMSVESGYVLVLYMPYNKNKNRSIVEEDVIKNKMKKLFENTKSVIE